MERAVLRIIDANFNRAREATRLVEEFCRFGLNNASLSSRAKGLRHQLCSAVEKLETDKLIANRDAADDVGRDMQIAGQLKRTDLRDCFVAASKRLTEALRVLAETTQTFDPATARTFEQLRFTAYTLEKDITIFASAAEKFRPVRLYVVLTATTANKPAGIVNLARLCAEGGADCIQLRAKGINDDELFALAGELVKACQDAHVVSIINDRVDIACAVGADGVHLGQNDMPITEARKLQFTPMIFGVSTHSAEQLKAAIAQRADYVGIGPVFATNTKPGAETAGLEYVAEATELLTGSGIDHVAIGGIIPENLDRVLNAGAKCVAVCSAVMDAADPKAVCEALKARLIE